MDGVNVILLALMAVAFMDGITRQFIAEPIRLLGISALAFTVSFGALAAGGLLFRLFAPADQALMIGFSSGLRNMMMLIAAAGGAIPDTTWLYVGLAQFPIYLLPYFMKPVANLITVTTPERAHDLSATLAFRRAPIQQRRDLIERRLQRQGVRAPR